MNWPRRPRRKPKSGSALRHRRSTRENLRKGGNRPKSSNVNWKKRHADSARLKSNVRQNELVQRRFAETKRNGFNVNVKLKKQRRRQRRLKTSLHVMGIP